MTRLVAIALLLIGTTVTAHAFGFGLGNRFGRLGTASKAGTVIPQPTGDILLADGTSFLLQTDASSLVCRAGGC